MPHLMALHNALFHMVFATEIVSATSAQAQANDRKDVKDNVDFGGHMTSFFFDLPQLSG